MQRPLAKKRKNPQIKRGGSAGFRDGLNTLAHPSSLKDSELSEFINGVYSQYGTLSKRLGSTILGNTAENATKINTLQSIYSVDGIDRHFRISDNGKPEVFSFTNNTWSYFSGTAPQGYTGSSPSFNNGVPTFNTTVKTHIKRLGKAIYFLNSEDQMCYWLNGQWYVWSPVADPTTKPTVTKTGSGTGSQNWFYYFVWYNEVGGTLPSPSADPAVDPNGTGYRSGMPNTLNDTTYLTVTLPTPPANAVKVGIYRSNTKGIGYYVTSIDATTTTYIDKGQDNFDPFFGLPERNDTKGQQFRLVEVYQDKLIGVTKEFGDEYLAWSGEPYTSPSGTPSFAIEWGGGYIPYRLGEGTKINAIKVHIASNEDSLYVFKDSSFGQFRFNELGGQVRDINIAVGSLSQESPHIAGNNLRFWSRDGAASVGNEANYGNILRYSVLSLRASGITERVTAANLPQVCGVYFKSLSIFAISTTLAGEGNNACLVYDERYNSWVLWTGLFVNTFAKMISPIDRVERLYYGSNKTADVVEMFKGKTDYGTTGTNGTKVTLSITTKQYDMNLADKFKKFDRVSFVFGSLSGQNTTIGVSYLDEKGLTVLPRYKVDTLVSNSGVEWGQAEFGMLPLDQEVENNSIVRYFNLKQKDMFWVKLNIQNDGLNDEMSLLGVFIYYSDSGKQISHKLRIKRLAIT
jgi:hypothetical protein